MTQGTLDKAIAAARAVTNTRWCMVCAQHRRPDGGLTVLGTATASGHVPELLADASRAWREAEGAPGELQ